MAYREVRVMDIEQVIRRWTAGEAIRAIARTTGLDRNTVRRLVRVAEKTGLKAGEGATEEQLQAIRKGIGQPGASSESSEVEQCLQPHRQRIQSWLKDDRLLLTKVHELLGREGIVSSYAALYRFARKWCEFGRRSVTVRRQEGAPGEAAEVDFGRLGLFQELGSGRPRVLWAFIMTMNYSRLSCVVPTFTQDLKSVIDCFERAFEFFGGCPRRIVIDNFKAAVETADRYTPRLNKTFLEYANHRGFLPDAARPRHPKDKPIVENTVRYARERFWKGETFIDLEDVWRRSQRWCRDVAGRRIHGTTRAVPVEVFEKEERAVLIPWSMPRFDTPQWARCKVHPDHHIRFQQALYSLPTRWIGCTMDVRGDRSLVRIYNRGELIKTHSRQMPGKHSTDYADYPDERAPFARRWPDFYRKKAQELGEHAGTFVEKLFEGEFPWARLRQAQKLLRLAERYGAERLDHACQRALRFELVDVRGVERILQQALERDPTPEAVHGQSQELPLKFLRPADHFAHSQRSKGDPSC
jgi:transposase